MSRCEVPEPPDEALAGAVELLCASFGGRAVREAPLGALTTYRVGGRATLQVEIASCDDLRAVHRALAAVPGPVPVLVLGQGSNLLVADAGFRGLVLGLGPAFDHIEVRGTSVRAGGATKLPVLARRSVAAGLTGLEWAVGVPGSVGGALRMNAGGHGSDTASVLARCGVFDLATGHAEERPAAALELGYRRSALGPADVVLWAEFALAPGHVGAGQETLSEVVRWRREHQPGGANAGSVFQNPPDDSAGRLLDAAGLRGVRLASAQVSDKHANFIQADQRGRADDVRRLIEHARTTVAGATGITLDREVRLVGFDDVAPPLVDARGAVRGLGGPDAAEEGAGPDGRGAKRTPGGDP